MDAPTLTEESDDMRKIPGNNLLLRQNTPSQMRWVMISFAFVATVLNYLHRLSFNYLTAQGYLRDIIPDDYFGYIASSFFIAYMIGENNLAIFSGNCS